MKGSPRRQPLDTSGVGVTRAQLCEQRLVESARACSGRSCAHPAADWAACRYGLRRSGRRATPGAAQLLPLHHEDKRFVDRIQPSRRMLTRVGEVVLGRRLNKCLKVIEYHEVGARGFSRVQPDPLPQPSGVGRFPVVRSRSGSPSR